MWTRILSNKEKILYIENNYFRQNNRNESDVRENETVIVEIKQIGLLLIPWLLIVCHANA